MSRPKISHGYDFDGRRIGRVTFDLKAADVGEQIEKFFAERPGITVSPSQEPSILNDKEN